MQIEFISKEVRLRVDCPMCEARESIPIFIYVTRLCKSADLGWCDSCKQNFEVTDLFSSRDEMFSFVNSDVDVDVNLK
mgnify:CR=1 FL=1